MVTSPSYFRRSSGTISITDDYELRTGLVISIGSSLEIVGPGRRNTIIRRLLI